MGLLASLIPYFILAFFSYPSTDDFAYATKVLDFGFWAGQFETYNTWSGRYFATLLLSFNPVAQKWIWGFPLLPIALLLGLWGSLWYALNSALQAATDAAADNADNDRRPSLLSKKQIFWLATTLFSIFLSHIQTPVQAFYWMAGAVTYTVPLILVSFAVGLFFKLYRQGKLYFRHWLALLIFAPIIVGSNETIMLQWMALLSLLLYFLFRKYRKVNLGLLGVFLLSFMGSLVVILAPGNKVRTSHFQDAHRPFYAIYRTIGACIEHSVQFLSLPLILLSLVVLGWTLQNREAVLARIPSRMPKWLIFGFFSTMMTSAFFPSMWAMGGNPPERVDNTTYFWFLLFWLMTLVIWVAQHPERYQDWLKKRPELFKSERLLFLSVLALLLIDNHRIAYSNLFVAEDYQKEWMARQAQSEKAGFAGLKGTEGTEGPGKMRLEFAPLKNKPKIIFNEDLNVDPTHWHNEAWSKYFGLASVRTLEQ